MITYLHSFIVSFSKLNNCQNAYTIQKRSSCLQDCCYYFLDNSISPDLQAIEIKLQYPEKPVFFYCFILLSPVSKRCPMQFETFAECEERSFEGFWKLVLDASSKFYFREPLLWSAPGIGGAGRGTLLYWKCLRRKAGRVRTWISCFE